MTLTPLCSSGRSRKPSVQSERGPAVAAGKAGSGHGSEPDTDADSVQLQPLSGAITKAFDADDLNPDVVPSVHGKRTQLPAGWVKAREMFHSHYTIRANEGSTGYSSGISVLCHRILKASED